MTQKSPMETFLFMKALNYFYQHINILSLDVVGGAVVSALFFGTLLQVSVPIVSLVALGITVWIIYTVDHLGDAMIIPRIASTDRHRFHQKHFRAIVAVLFVAIVADLVVIGFLSVSILQAGLLLGAIVLVYLVLHRHLRFLKEFFVAAL